MSRERLCNLADEVAYYTYDYISFCDSLSYKNYGRAEAMKELIYNTFENDCCEKLSRVCRYI